MIPMVPIRQSRRHPLMPRIGLVAVIVMIVVAAGGVWYFSRDVGPTITADGLEVESRPNPESVSPRPPVGKPPASEPLVLISNSRPPDPPTEPIAPVFEPGDDLSGATSPEAVRSWIAAKADLIGTGRSYKTTDPIITALATVPSQYWSVMFDELAVYKQHTRMTGYLRHALVRSVRSQHHDLVLAALGKHTWLIDAVIAQGWQSDAADIIRSCIAPPKYGGAALADTARMVEALATVGDERDFPLMSDVLVQSRYGYWQAAMARSLAKVPGFDLAATTRRAWRKYGRGDYPDGQDGFAVAAARAGIHEALAITIRHAAGGEDTRYSTTVLREEARALLADHFGLTIHEDDPAPLLAWWSGAQELVTWQESSSRWTGPPASPALTGEPVQRPAGANDF